jgi:SAM-dependent methyltransferase
VGDYRVELPYIDYEWTLRPDDCPCDVQFIEWLDDRRIADAAIYHFGTGAHHYVGIECAKPERRNSVMGITASPEEYDAFIKLSIRNPEILRHYNAVFGDIYLLNGRLLPTFDVVTLFHLCEFRVWQHDAVGALTDREVLNLLSDHTKPGGHLLFYEGSHAWDWNHIKARDVVREWASERDVEQVDAYKRLVVYRKRS